VISRSTPAIACALRPFTATRSHECGTRKPERIDRVLDVFRFPGLRFLRALFHRKHRVDPYRFMLDNKEALPWGYLGYCSTIHTRTGG
jgi:hypothetical protein